MRLLKNVWRNLLRRDRVERDMDDELRATLELLVDEKVHRGMPPAAARRAAHAELGAVEAIKDQVRDARTGAFFEALVQDLRYGARLLRRNPLFTLTATLSLAVGIAATTTIFTVANGLLLRAAVGVSDPDRLVDIARRERGESGLDPISYPDYLDVRSRSRSFDGVYAYHLDLEPVSFRVDESAERVFANLVTTNYFQVLGVQPQTGRVFGGGDSEEPGESPVVVLSHRFWVRRFNADPAVVGAGVRLNGHPFTIVGVAREGFRGTSVLAPDVWIPTAMTDVARAGSEMPRLRVRESGWLMVGARLKPGVSRAHASTEVATIASALAREFAFDRRYIPPGAADPIFEWSAVSASAIPYGLRPYVAAFFAFLMAIVSTVLVIACANVAGILLTRATTRRREIAVRAAIGAARARVVRQLLTETILLFVLGGIGGLALARFLTSLIVKLLPAFPLPVNLSVPLDGRVAVFSLAVALVAAVLSGLTPALQAAKIDVVSAIKDDEQLPVERMRLRNAFVIAQVALSTLLVVVAAILVRGFDRITAFDRGYDSRGVDAATIDLSMAGYTAATGPGFARALVERVRALPGVETATLADRIPGPGSMNFGNVTVPGVTPPNGMPAFFPNWTLVESGYFSTLRIPIVAGRDFSPADGEGAERVAIIGEQAARAFWPEGDAIGRSILVQDATPPTPLRIVGVVRDIGTGAASKVVDTQGTAPKLVRSSGDVPFALYVPFQQQYQPQVTILARGSSEASRAGDLHVLVTSMDPNLPVLSAQTLESLQNGPVEAQLRISAAVAGSVGLVGLLLAAMGVYGVTAYSVSRRTREIGIRLSLGARPIEVIGLVVRQGMRLVATGSVAGLLMGTAAGALLSRRFNIPAADAWLLAGAATLFALVGLLACVIPARRATGIRAMQALRAES